MVNGGLSFWGYSALANGSNLDALTCSVISLMLCSGTLILASMPHMLCARCCSRDRLSGLVINVFLCFLHLDFCWNTVPFVGSLVRSVSDCKWFFPQVLNPQ